jgi:hypothetical protein
MENVKTLGLKRPLKSVVVVESEDGDWTEIYLDGAEVHQGHDVPTEVWIGLLKKAGYMVDERTVTAHELGACSIGCEECGKEEPWTV